MSVLIKGMEMPKSCFDCPFMYGRKYCRANSKIEFNDPDYSELKGRYPGCPLVLVPPHGRLIEDVAVREQIDEWLDSVGDVVVGHGLSYYGELLGCIEDAPTIIEAEEGE